MCALHVHVVTDYDIIQNKHCINHMMLKKMIIPPNNGTAPGSQIYLMNYFFTKSFNVINNLGYDGYIGCEYKPLNQTIDSLKWAVNFGINSKIND